MALEEREPPWHNPHSSSPTYRLAVGSRSSAPDTGGPLPSKRRFRMRTEPTGSQLRSRRNTRDNATASEARAAISEVIRRQAQRNIELCEWDAGSCWRLHVSTTASAQSAGIAKDHHSPHTISSYAQGSKPFSARETSSAAHGAMPAVLQGNPPGRRVTGACRYGCPCLLLRGTPLQASTVTSSSRARVAAT